MSHFAFCGHCAQRGSRARQSMTSGGINRRYRRTPLQSKICFRYCLLLVRIHALLSCFDSFAFLCTWRHVCTCVTDIIDYIRFELIHMRMKSVIGSRQMLQTFADLFTDCSSRTTKFRVATLTGKLENLELSWNFDNLQKSC